MFEVVRVFAVGAVTLSYAIGLALGLAIAMALTEPMHASVLTALGRVWAWVRKALSVALGWLARTRLARLAVSLSVTYLHMYPADSGTGRHFEGRGRRFVRPGRHRMA